MMTDAEKTLVLLLRRSLSGETARPPGPPADRDRHIDIEEIFRLAARHGVLGPLIMQAEQRPDMRGHEQLLTRWKNQALYEAAIQANATEQLLKTLGALDRSGLRYVMIKGLCLKRLYAQPDFRYMKDADILVEKQSVPAAAEALTKLGYTLHKDSVDHPTHWEFSRPFGYSVELHFSLCNRNLLKNNDPTVWETRVWENTRVFDYNGTSVPALSPENELIGLVVHLGTHYVGMDVSLQKIYDFGLFIKSYAESLDNRYIESMLEPMRLLPFYRSLLAMLRDCFGLTGRLFNGVSDIFGAETLLEDMLADYGLKEVRDRVAVAKLQWYCRAERHHRIRICPVFLIVLVPWQLIKQKKSFFDCIRLSYKALRIFRKRKAVLIRAGVG